MLAQFAHMNIKSGEVTFVCYGDHRLIRFTIMNRSQRGDARLTDEPGKCFFRG